jgi:repressor LexA
MAKGLTKRQQTILQYILDYVQKEGYPPSIREIGRDFEIGSLRGVTVHLDALEKKGFISRSNTPRSIKVIHPSYQSSSRVTMLPLIGAIGAGGVTPAQEEFEDMIPVPSEMVRNTTGAFLLRVRGESMLGDGILPRDLVVIKPQVTANQGEIVAALVGEEATVKRINFAKEGILLMPSNPSYEPIPFGEEGHLIIGKVIGLIRDYQGMAF